MQRPYDNVTKPLLNFIRPFIQPGLDFIPDLVPDLAEEGKFFLFGAFKGSRVFKWPVQADPHTWEIGTMFVCTTANGDEEVEIKLSFILIQVFGSVSAHVKACFFHHLDCIWVDAVRFKPCAVNLKAVPTQFFKICLGDLRAAGVAGAEE